MQLLSVGSHMSHVLTTQGWCKGQCCLCGWEKRVWRLPCACVPAASPKNAWELGEQLKQDFWKATERFASNAKNRLVIPGRRDAILEFNPPWVVLGSEFDSRWSISSTPKLQTALQRSSATSGAFPWEKRLSPTNNPKIMVSWSWFAMYAHYNCCWELVRCRREQGGSSHTHRDTPETLPIPRTMENSIQ